MDFVGCFLSWDINFEAGPNASNFSWKHLNMYMYPTYTPKKFIFLLLINEKVKLLSLDCCHH